MISEQGKKEESVLSCYWDCHISNYHWDNCMANKEVTKQCDIKPFEAHLIILRILCKFTFNFFWFHF